MLLVLVVGLGLPKAARSAPDADAGSGSVVVAVDNLQHVGQGQLVVLVYEQVDRVEVNGVKFLQRTIVPVTGERLTITVEGLPYGDYAVALLHDMDKDLVADTNLIGFPNEDLGVSNNAKGGPLGGPKWDKAKFEHRGARTQLSITMWRVHR